MYFLSDVERETCLVSERLENIKLMRKVDLQIHSQYDIWEKFFKCGRCLVLYAVDWVAGEVSVGKFDQNGDVQQFKSSGINTGRPYAGGVYMAPYSCGIYFDSLPIVGSCNELADRRVLKFSFYKIPGIVSGKIEMDDVTINIDLPIIVRTVLQSSDYVAVILCTFNEETLGLKRNQLWLLLFESRLGREKCYNFLQLCQKNLKEYITKDIYVETMIYNKTAAIMLFSVLTFHGQLMLLIYNMKTHNIEQTIEAFENETDMSKVFFVDHLDYEGGVIVAVSKTKNQIKLFSKSLGEYTLLKCVSLNISQSRISSLFCHSNRKNQILFFNAKDGEMSITDLFNVSNVAIVTYDGFDPQLFFSETGEEIYARYEDSICVYLYRSMFKSLLFHCAYIVASVYTEDQLNDMQLPKHLYKYLRAF